jgi:fucose 4-O-acetylase-like acetyltransferase
MHKVFFRSHAMFAHLWAQRLYNFPVSFLSSRNLQIETLRGLAIVLVVFGHIIGSTQTGGMRVSDDSIFRYFYFSLEYIRMPLFTIISGWVYACKPVSLLDRNKFVSGKVRRLLMPMFVISTLLFLSRIVIPGTNTKPELSDLKFNIIFPYDIYWYLYSLFIIFLVITIIDTQPFFKRIEGWSVVLMASLLMLIICKIFLTGMPNFFSIKGATYLFPFFLTGIGIFRFKEIMLNRKMLLWVCILFACSIFIQQLTWFGFIPSQPKHSFLGLTVGITAALILFQLNWKNNVLVWIGNYAYAIFLFHVFFTGGTRIVLLKIGIDNKWVILLSALVLSVIIPIIIEALLRKSALLKFVFLGLKKTEK